MIGLRLTILGLCVIICGCKHEYAKAVKHDTERIFASQKQFIHSLSFAGRVLEKKYCHECDLNRYQIVIQLEELSPELIELKNQSFQPYFNFSSQSYFTTSVSKSLFDFVEQGNLIRKQQDSNFVWYGESKLLLLSNEESQWIPR
jgi:hypothetical protein